MLGTGNIQVLLVLPTTDELVKLKQRSALAPAYGLNIVAESFRQAGYETMVLDEFMLKHCRELQDCKSWVGAIFKVLQYYPGIKMVGFSVLTNFRKTVLNISRLLRMQRPDLYIVWGGPHVTGLHKEIFFGDAGCFDAAVSGALDKSIVKYLGSWLDAGGGKPQLKFLEGSLSQNIGWELAPSYDQYLDFCEGVFPRLILRTTQGCPWGKCKFCSARLLEGEYVLCDHEKITRELDRAISYNPGRIEFHDQDLLWDDRHFKRIISMISEKSSHRIEEFYCHASMESISIEKLALIRELSSTWKIFIGLETISSRLRRQLGKKPLNNHDLAKFTELVEWSRKSNIEIGLYVMFGIPGEKPEDSKMTIDFLKRLGNIELCFLLMKVFPGTPLYRKLLAENKLSRDIWFDEERPDMVTAVEGHELERAKAYWAHALEEFPQAKMRNAIDKKMLSVGEQ